MRSAKRNRIAHRSVRSSNRRDRGSIAWVMIMAVLFLILATIILSATHSGVKRSQEARDSQLVTQRTNSALAAAISAITANPNAVANTRDAALATGGTVDCQTINGRPVCYAYWALPVPGQAVEPVRYNVVTNVWIDSDGDRLPPASDYRASLVTIDAITYQNDPDTEGLHPEVNGPEGYVAYPPTPLGLFASAIHGFSSVRLNGSTDGTKATRVDVSSYNSLTGLAGTGNAVVSSDGAVSYAARTKADRTVLFGGSSGAGDFTERCTGEACDESDVRVLVDTHIKPTDVSMRWMDTVACAAYNGDWRASDHGGRLPAGNWCINGNLIIDVPAVTSGPTTVLNVRGNIAIDNHLNPPDLAQANPGALVIYSTARTVTFNVPDVGAAGTSVAALLYAPLATCGNNVAGNAAVSYYGSLVCDVMSISGPWEHQWDEAGAVRLREIVPGARKVWTVGTTQKVDEGSHHTPEGWDRLTCVAPRPANAWGWWKLDERAPSTVARNSAGTGSRDAGWSSATAARPEGVCGQAAAMLPTGAISYPTVVPGSTQNGATVEYWAKNAVGTVFEGAGIKVEHINTTTSPRHVRVTAGGTARLIPFTVQNFDRWHLYTVTVAPDGQARLYIDGVYKDSGKAAAIAAAGSAITVGTAASGAPAGAIDEVVYYERQLTGSGTNEVKQRWDAWSRFIDTTTIPSSGTPFTAPGGLTNLGSDATAVKLRWTAATGTLTPSSAAHYRVEYSTTSGGTYTQGGENVPMGTLTGTLLTPPLGTHYYRVCTVYNNDKKCTGAISIVTMVMPTAPAVTLDGTTRTTATYKWNVPTDTQTFEYQIKINEGSWSAAVSLASTVKSLTTPDTTQGNDVQFRIRARNALGVSGWSAVTATNTAKLVPAAPALNGWANSSSYPELYGQLANFSCAAGLVGEMNYQDKVTPREVDWRGNWYGWAEQTAADKTNKRGPRSLSSVYSYHEGAAIQQKVRCKNPTTGRVSAESGPHEAALWHPMPQPTGQYAKKIAGQRAHWGGTCPAGSHWRGDVWINNTTFHWSNAWREPNEFFHQVNWGPGYIEVHGVCHEPRRVGHTAIDSAKLITKTNYS